MHGTFCLALWRAQYQAGVDTPHGTTYKQDTYPRAQFLAEFGKCHAIEKAMELVMTTKTDNGIGRVFFGLAIIVALLGPTPGFGKDSAKASRVRDLNNKVVQHHDRARGAASENKASIRAQAAPDFKEREEALADLIEDDPQEAIKFAFSPELLTDMGKEFPDSAAHLERFGTWQGTLEYAVADDLNLKTAKNIRRLKTDKETLHLHLSGPEPPLTSGMTVTVTGVAAGGNVAAQGEVAFASAVVGPVGMACGNTGAQHVVTILANLPSYTLGAEVDQEHMKGILYGNANSSKQSATDWSLDDFWQQQLRWPGLRAVCGRKSGRPLPAQQRFQQRCEQLHLLRLQCAGAGGD